MLEDGYIKLYRSMLKWEWYDDINTCRLFLHLLLTVNHYDEQWHGVLVKRGQRICSYGKLEKETRLSVQSVRTAIKHLISTGELTHEATAEYGLFTINNYEKYQVVTHDATDDQHTTNRRPTHDQQQSKKAKNIKNINTCAEQTLSAEPTAIFLTLNDGDEYPIFESKVTEWTALYPAVSVMQELRKMKAWLDANPKRRKTRSGIMRFINAWLSKAQDKGGSNIQQNTDNNTPPYYHYL